METHSLSSRERQLTIIHTTKHHPHKLYFAVSQLPVVRSEHLRTLFDSTQPQESNFEFSLTNRTQQCTLGPILHTSTLS